MSKRWFTHKLILLGLLLLPVVFFGNASANDMVNAITSLKIDKSQMQQSLRMLRESGQITEAQEKQALRKLASMNDDQLNNLTQKAAQKVKDGEIDPEKIKAAQEKFQKK